MKSNLKIAQTIDFETEFINPVLNAITKKIETQPIIMMIENKNNEEKSSKKCSFY